MELMPPFHSSHNTASNLPSFPSYICRQSGLIFRTFFLPFSSSEIPCIPIMYSLKKYLSKFYCILSQILISLSPTLFLTHTCTHKNISIHPTSLLILCAWTLTTVQQCRPYNNFVLSRCSVTLYTKLKCISATHLSSQSSSSPLNKEQISITRALMKKFLHIKDHQCNVLPNKGLIFYEI